MRIRAVLFDIYGTLLELGPPPADAEARWNLLWRERAGVRDRLSLSEFAAACDQIIAREHAAARAVGINFPEVYWPAIAIEVLPELARLSEPERAEFLFQHAGLTHSVRLADGAAETLRLLANSGRLLGIASNSQPYTIRELDTALSNAGIARTIFMPSLSFFS
ncbi:MAG: hypothetical protein FJ388_22010, partial [Verrucomicrobia bacterium]|nr:hypothetical protein [Verrucomicrobiota bacterium]